MQYKNFFVTIIDKNILYYKLVIKNSKQYSIILMKFRSLKDLNVIKLFNKLPYEKENIEKGESNE